MLKALFALLLALGGGLLAVGTDLRGEDHAASGWMPVPAEVVDIHVRSPVDGLQDPAESEAPPAGQHYPVVRYRWDVDGQSFYSTRFRLGESLPVQPSRDAAHAAAAAWQVGQRLTAYRHPEQPERAVLDRGAPRRSDLLIGIGAFMLVLGAAGLLRAAQVAQAFARRD